MTSRSKLAGKRDSFFLESASTLATQIVLIAISVVGGAMVARILGPELKGKAALIDLLAHCGFMFFSLGLGASFSFAIAKDKYRNSQIVSAAIVSGVILWLIGVSAFTLSWNLHRSIWSGLPINFLVIGALLALNYILINYGTRILIGQGKINEVNAASLIKALVNFSLVVIAVWYFDLGLAGLLVGLLASTVVQIVTIGWLTREDVHFDPFWSGDFIAQNLTYGLKSHALLVINFLNYRVDLALLKHFDGDFSVGIYSLAVGMAELMWLIPNSAVAPLFSRVATADAMDGCERTLRTVRFSILILTLMSVVGVFVGSPAIHLLYGKEFGDSYYPFLALLPGICLFPVFKLLTVDLAARGRPGIGTIASAIALLINVGANCWLIPRLGVVGAGLATSISYLCMSTVVLALFMRINKRSLREILWLNDSDRKLIWGILKSAYKRVRDLVAGARG
ncbi:lipopolysaccharide biosynthesis protein [Rhodopirellula sallentina]|uniref:Polysaccharide biosynthesis protein n=1 Tax=Rhodopirellula sallentina SM41 TaxID=1263870 RepID=M5UGF4_9BACT|nr:polysaccharide biosynthesis C-terminal domain-containing protein [Rhodopirellula sallentina]EMI56921.1 polysaccharide biosynthesis protein [Rhodopirellula sallentina SM41]